MYVILWEYQVRSENISEFEKIYSPNGAWAELFKRGNGYIGTELFRDVERPQRYITIDRWESVIEYKAFQAQWKKEYEALDAQCEGLTELETLLGKWETDNY